MTHSEEKTIGRITFTTEAQDARSKLNLWLTMGSLCCLGVLTGGGFYHYVVMPGLVHNAYLHGTIEGYECGTYKNADVKDIPDRCIGG
jgi:hypothetical protein